MSDEWRFLAAAYAITWVVVIAYGTYVELRWRRARASIDEASQ